MLSVHSRFFLAEFVLTAKISQGMSEPEKTSDLTGFV